MISSPWTDLVYERELYDLGNHMTWTADSEAMWYAVPTVDSDGTTQITTGYTHDPNMQTVSVLELSNDGISFEEVRVDRVVRGRPWTVDLG